MSPKELSLRLSERALDVCVNLFPQGRQEGLLFKIGSIDGDDGKSLQVNIAGTWVGKWRDWADDSFHGDLLDLWQQAKGITPPEARKQAMDFLGISLPSNIKEYAQPPKDPKICAPAEDGAIMTYLTTDRKLEPSIINRFKVEGRGASREIVFPSYSPSGILVNRSYCKLERDKEGKKIVRQEKGCAPCLFGWHAFSEEDWKAGYVIICEGQIDAMTWRQWGHPALSIPNGAGKTWIDYSFEDLEVFERIYISFDMDKKVSQDDLSLRLGAARTAFVSLPYKDANDCLKAGCSAEESKEWVSKAKLVAPPNIHAAKDLKGPFLKRIQEGDNGVGFATSLFRFFNRDQFKFRPGEVTLWVGISNHGKSSFLRFLFTIFLKHLQATGIASLEVPCDKTLKSMFLSTKGNSQIGPEEWIDAVGELIVFYNRVGYAEEKELCDAIEYCARRFDVKHFMIDSLMRVEGLEEDYPRQGKFMNRLQEVAKKTGVHIHLVAHERKDKTEDGDPDANSIKGSSLLRNNADNIFFVRRNMEKRRAIRDGKISQDELAGIHDTTVYLEKDRETGFTGRVLLKYIKETEQFFPITEDPEPVHSANGSNGHRPDPYRGKRNHSEL